MQLQPVRPSTRKSPKHATTSIVISGYGSDASICERFGIPFVHENEKSVNRYFPTYVEYFITTCVHFVRMIIDGPIVLFGCGEPATLWQTLAEKLEQEFMSKPQVVILSRNPSFTSVLQFRLKDCYRFTVSASFDEVEEFFQSNRSECFVADFETTCDDGHAEDRLLESLQQRFPEMVIVIVTAEMYPEPLERRSILQRHRSPAAHCRLRISRTCPDRTNSDRYEHKTEYGSREVSEQQDVDGM